MRRRIDDRKYDEDKTENTMITIQDLYNILETKIANEAQKTLISNNFPPQVADRMCAAIDGQQNGQVPRQ